MAVDEEMQTINRVLNGDTDAFEELVVANQKNVYNLALKITGNEEDACDISQEAFLRAYTQLGSFRGHSRFSVWMYRLTYNLSIDFLRKKKRENVVSLSYSDENDDAIILDIPDIRELPEEVLVRRESRETISESIDELASDHRQILIMREITGMSYEDMAEALGISEGTVKSRLSRARKNLTSILVNKGTFPENYRQKDREEVEEHG